MSDQTCHQCGQSGMRYVTHVCPLPDDAQHIYTSAVLPVPSVSFSSEDATRPTGDKA